MRSLEFLFFYSLMMTLSWNNIGIRTVQMLWKNIEHVHWTRLSKIIYSVESKRPVLVVRLVRIIYSYHDLIIFFVVIKSTCGIGLLDSFYVFFVYHNFYTPWSLEQMIYEINIDIFLPANCFFLRNHHFSFLDSRAYVINTDFDWFILSSLPYSIANEFLKI